MVTEAEKRRNKVEEEQIGGAVADPSRTPKRVAHGGQKREAGGREVEGEDGGGGGRIRDVGKSGQDDSDGVQGRKNWRRRQRGRRWY